MCVCDFKRFSLMLRESKHPLFTKCILCGNIFIVPYMNYKLEHFLQSLVI